MEFSVLSSNRIDFDDGFLDCSDNAFLTIGDDEGENELSSSRDVEELVLLVLARRRIAPRSLGVSKVGLSFCSLKFAAKVRLLIRIATINRFALTIPVFHRHQP